MNNLIQKLSSKRAQRFFKYGAPFLLLMVGGSFGLREFTSLRYTYSKKSVLRPEDLAKEGIEMKPRGSVTLESEYEKIKNINVDNWKNIRGPRPWEEPSEDLKNQIKELEQKHK